MKRKMNRPATPTTYYIVDEEKLQIADVIVTTTSDKLSKGIRVFTKGEFSHVTIYAGAGHYLDATNNGVQSNVLSRMLLEKPSHGKILRLKAALTTEERIEIVSLVRVHIGKEYSIPQAMLAGLPGRSKRTTDSSNRQFCSRLVAEAYEGAGYPIVSNASFCTPEQINSSLLFRPVPDCIREATQEEILSAQSTDEGLSTPMQQLHNTILSQVRELTSVDIQEFTSLSKFAALHPEFDQQIANILKESGYLDLWRKEYETNTFLYDSEEFKKMFPSAVERHNASVHFHNKNESVWPHYSQSYETLRIESAKYQSVTLNAEFALYEQLIKLCEIRKSVVEPYLNTALANEMERWGHLPPDLLNLAAKFFDE